MNHNQSKPQEKITYDHPVAAFARETLNHSINQDKIRIDTKVFQKTAYEKELLKKMKFTYKLNQKRLGLC